MTATSADSEKEDDESGETPALQDWGTAILLCQDSGPLVRDEILFSTIHREAEIDGAVWDPSNDDSSLKVNQNGKLVNISDIRSKKP